MNFQEIKEAIQNGKNVFWINTSYKVSENGGNYYITHIYSRSCVGLHLPTYFKNGVEIANADFFIN